jgi:hypothetical protein
MERRETREAAAGAAAPGPALHRRYDPFGFFRTLSKKIELTAARRRCA